MNIIITGIGGLLGRELAGSARRAGHRVIGVARRFDPAHVGLADEWVIQDLADGTQQNWRSIVGDAVVLHLAADTRIYGDAEALELNNVAATVTACAIARQTGGRMVFFSSSAVYSGDDTTHPGRPLAENAPRNPMTAYGRSKKAAEELIAASGVSAIVLRVFGVLSERLMVLPETGNLVQAIGRSLRNGEELKLGVDAAGRTAVRDYVSSEDVADFALQAAAMLMKQSGPLGATQFINLCTGIPTSTWEMAQLAQVATVRMFPLRFEQRSDSANEVMVGDPGLLKRVLGRVPRPGVREFWARVAVNRCCDALGNSAAGR